MKYLMQRQKNKESVNQKFQKFINNSDLEKMIETLSTKAESKEEQDKRTKLQTYD